MQTVLAIDDELSVRESYRMILGDRYNVVCAEDGPTGLKCLDERYADIILLDLAMPGMTGMEFLGELEARGETIPVLVVTGSNSIEAAVKAIKKGAREFVIKPFDIDDLVLLVERNLEEMQQRRELSNLRAQATTGFENMIGKSAALQGAIAKAQQAMQVDSTVLITGETGTGKDVIARAIHYGGQRSDKAFVPLSCCAIPAPLVESELFGHVKGAFTGAVSSAIGKLQVADGGTLFLDEIGEMPMEAQAKMLRVLQDGTFYPVGGTKVIEVDVRFVCATNRAFAKSIADGLFREDLYYRINVLPIELPALRERKDDIPLLIQHFVALHGPRVNSNVQEFSPRALNRMTGYHWPGNVRELENTVERVLVCHGDKRSIDADHLDGMLPGSAPTPANMVSLDAFEGLGLDEATRRIERHLITLALERCNNVQSQAAEYLGTTRRILKYKMDQLGIDGDSPAPAAADDA